MKVLVIITLTERLSILYKQKCLMTNTYVKYVNVKPNQY